jgi:hypothetical protein
LSDPIPGPRAKDGDHAALSALCERRAGVERWLRICSPTRRTPDAAQEALAKVRPRQAVSRRVGFTTWRTVVVNTCATWPRGSRAALRAAGRGPARAADGARPVAVGACRLLGSRPNSRRSPPGARGWSLKDAFDWSFTKEIASRDGIPIGTAKCAHTGRGLRERLAR